MSSTDLSEPAVGRFIGVLESPLERGGEVLGERLPIRGWAVAPRPIQRIRARCGTRRPCDMRIDAARPDLAAVLPDRPEAARCGFSGEIDIGHLLPGEHRLTVTVYDRDAAVHEWQRTVRVGDAARAYADWRERRLAAAVRQIDPAAAGAAAITWLVRTAAATPAGAVEATLASIAAGAPCCAVEVEVVRFDGTGPAPSAAASQTPYVGSLDAGARLAEGASALFAARLAAAPGVDLVYADHDHLDPAGSFVDPVLKPGWSVLNGEIPAFAAGAWVARRELFDADPRQALGAGTRLPAEVNRRCERVAHIALPLCALRGPTPLPARPSVAVLAKLPRVSVIVPTRLADRALLTRCLDGLRRATDWPDLEIVVVLNNLVGIDVADARDLLQPWSAAVLHEAGGFNWSTLNERGAQAAGGEWLLFLNDDVEPLRPDWLRAMVAAGQRPGTGAVGAVLRYPDGRLQHAGVFIDRPGSGRVDCRHLFRDCTGRESRVARWLAHDRTQTAVTGACLLSRREVFFRAGGFDPGLPVVFNDIDYCLRLRRDLALDSVVAAAAELTHHEGVSRGGIAEQADHDAFCARWAAELPALDPYRHPGLAPGRDDWVFDPEAGLAPAGPER